MKERSAIIESITKDLSQIVEKFYGKLTVAEFIGTLEIFKLELIQSQRDE